ncbi:MAG: MSHA biogenesis protein MshO [Colwellia sp.]|jgi:MSHA biogenesis protein MshO
MISHFRQSYNPKKESSHKEYLKSLCSNVSHLKVSNCKVIKSKGFTLIEFIVAMVILGILAVGISSFVQFGSRMYADVSARDQILSSARFAIERLNRELRGALPNSARITTNECLEFMPIISSTVYVDIPVSPDDASDEITIVPTTASKDIVDTINESGYSDDPFNAMVYPTSPDDVYLESNNKFYPIVSATYSTNEATIPHSLFLNNAELFAEDSTTSRVYFVDESVMYCIEANDDDYRLIRYDVASHTAAGTPVTDVDDGVVMADFLTEESVFSTESANLQRNSIVSIRLNFKRQYEEIVFENEVQVPNVP